MTKDQEIADLRKTLSQLQSDNYQLHLVINSESNARRIAQEKLTEITESSRNAGVNYLEEIDLIRAVLEGYSPSIARSDALCSVKLLKDYFTKSDER